MEGLEPKRSVRQKDNKDHVDEECSVAISSAVTISVFSGWNHSRYSMV